MWFPSGFFLWFVFGIGVSFDAVFSYVCANNRLVQTAGKKDAHYANTPMQYTAIFHGCKNVNFQIKNYNIFLFCSKTLIVGTH